MHTPFSQSQKKNSLRIIKTYRYLHHPWYLRSVYEWPRVNNTKSINWTLQSLLSNEELIKKGTLPQITRLEGGRARLQVRCSALRDYNKWQSYCLLSYQCDLHVSWYPSVNVNALTTRDGPPLHNCNSSKPTWSLILSMNDFSETFFPPELGPL